MEPPASLTAGDTTREPRRAWIGTPRGERREIQDGKKRNGRNDGGKRAEDSIKRIGEEERKKADRKTEQIYRIGRNRREIPGFPESGRS